MKWSWKLGTVAGIDVYVHATFLILIGWFALNYWLAGRGLAGVVVGLAFILALFGCVLLHELGHALTARKYGIRTRDISLLPIGGVARLEKMPDDPRQEFWVAVAGPAVNVVIALILFLVLLLVNGGRAPDIGLGIGGGSILAQLMNANILLVVFNLIPAFPMDGGRVLRSLLATRMDYMRATQFAATLGQGIAFLFGLFGLLSGQPFMLFTALFVWIGAAQESSLVQMKTALGGIPVSRAMLTDFRVLSPTDTVARAVELILAGSQQDFPVVDNDRTVGILTRSRLVSALSERGQGALVADVMQREFQAVNPREMLDQVAARLQESDCYTVPVTQDGQISGPMVGLLTMDNIGEFLMIRSALSTGRSKERQPARAADTQAVADRRVNAS